MYTFRFFLGLVCAILIAACGGGGGSPGANPNQPNLVTTAGAVLTLPAGAFREYAVSGGVPPYQVSSSDPAIAVGNISGNTLSIGALAGGKAAIRVFDYKGAFVMTDITVGSSIPLYTTAPSSVNIGINVPPRIFAIGGGSPPYTVEGGNDSVAIIRQTDATHWSIVGVAANSSGTVKVRDSAGAVVDVSFSTNPPELRISPDKLAMPAGMEAQVTVSGGQPPYYPAGGLPAAIQVTPAVSNDGKFKMVGNLASKLDVTFVDTAGQSAKVEVEINTATVSFRLSPSPVSISENSTDDLTFSLFGFHGDSGTGASSGSVCLYISDPKYFALDASRTTCSTFSSALRTFKLVTGTRGSRCVSADTPIQIRAVDSQGQTASGVLTIVNNGNSCGGTGALSTSPTTVNLRPGQSADVLVRGGEGRFTAVSGDQAVATVTIAGDLVSVKGGSIGGTTVVTVTDADTGATVTFTVNNSSISGGGGGALTTSPASVAVRPGVGADVLVLGGNGRYTAVSADPGVATVKVASDVVTVTGGNTTGNTSVTVTDAANGRTVNVAVSNGVGAVTLTATPSVVYTTPSTVATTIVQGGSGRYGVSNVNSAIIASVAVSETSVGFAGGAATGSVATLITDLNTGVTTNVLVINNANSALTANPSSVAALAVGVPQTIAISGGSGNYIVASANPAIATATLNGSTVTVTRISGPASTAVTVTDITSGRSVVIGVSTTP